MLISKTFIKNILRLVGPVNKFLTSNEFRSNIGPFIGQNAISTKNVLQKQRTDLADSMESATGNLNKEHILSVKQMQECQHMAGSGDATQPSLKLISTTLQKAKLYRHNKSVTSSSSKKGFFDDKLLNALPVGCTAEASFEKKFLLNWLRNARIRTEVSVLRVSIKHLSVFAFLQDLVITARHRASIFLSM